MKFVTQREVRLDPGKIWALARQERDIIVTNHGKPVAIVNPVDEDLEKTMQMMRRVRGLLALEEAQKIAKETGLSRMTLAEINREIQAVRRQRKRRK
jgi:antitoxin (DNA-binding transcriptional repressor) of toxin-antitoxin stability system